MAKTGNPSKVGDLLVESGILTEQDLKEGTDLSASLGLPIGKTMVMSGVLSERTVRAAVLVQSMLKDGLIEREMAVQALFQAHKKGTSVEDCLLELGWTPLSDQVLNKFGQLLVEAGAITKAELTEALEQVNTMGLPLGRVLVLTGKVKGAVVWCALNSQILLRSKKITRKQATNAVKAVHEKQISFEQGLRSQGLGDLMAEHRMKLGELLVLSGLIGEEEILGAVENSVVNEQPLGQVLIDLGLISKDRLSDALKLQEMSDNKTLSPLQSADVLRNVEKRNQSLNRAVAEMGLMKPGGTAESVRLGELLKLCGWITETEIEEAVGLASKNANLLGKMLVAFGFIDERMLFSTLRCQFLVREGFIKRDQAIAALHHSQSRNCSIDQALVELGYTQSPGPGDSALTSAESRQ